MVRRRRRRPDEINEDDDEDDDEEDDDDEDDVFSHRRALRQNSNPTKMYGSESKHTPRKRAIANWARARGRYLQGQGPLYAGPWAVKKAEWNGMAIQQTSSALSALPRSPSSSALSIDPSWLGERG